MNTVKSMMFYTKDEIAYLKDLCAKNINYNQVAVEASKKLERSYSGILQKLRYSKYPLKWQLRDQKSTSSDSSNKKKTFVITITIEEK